MHCIRKHESVYSFLAICNKRTSFKNMVRERLHHAFVLEIHSVCLNVHFLAFRASKRLRTVLAKRALVFSKLPDTERIVFTDNFSLRKRYLKSICSRSVSGRSDKYTCCTVGKFHVGSYVILHFNVMPFSFVTERTHFHGQPANPLEQIKLMRTLVEQHATTFAHP